ncbi:hypothetical protein M440DRAFT_283404 [Trichoderma longibrachiatum ATCC 18648]|uniref:Uncharacterized protein n=1 Tax=Trichoderma longibrachiatum ATCC 18648 TaxID=983965 RepID=A0A2T4C7M5_TRILO|nr:hypothetical protein M440DRAFT_283404 [Trichoderma longibrachiatum ATCC 18648]
MLPFLSQPTPPASTRASNCELQLTSKRSVPTKPASSPALSPQHRPRDEAATGRARSRCLRDIHRPLHADQLSAPARYLPVTPVPRQSRPCPSRRLAAAWLPPQVSPLSCLGYAPRPAATQALQAIFTPPRAP